MVVLDVAVPTGFEPVAATLAAVQSQPKVKRHDVAGRQVILYLDDMRLDEQFTVSFQARALYPVRAQPVSSQVYAYYRPDWKGESVGTAVGVAP
jgi:CD109 antigen